MVKFFLYLESQNWRPEEENPEDFWWWGSRWGESQLQGSRKIRDWRSYFKEVQKDSLRINYSFQFFQTRETDFLREKYDRLRQLHQSYSKIWALTSGPPNSSEAQEVQQEAVGGDRQEMEAGHPLCGQLGGGGRADRSPDGWCQLHRQLGRWCGGGGAGAE